LTQHRLGRDREREIERERDRKGEREEEGWGNEELTLIDAYPPTPTKLIYWPICEERETESPPKAMEGKKSIF
jgi:hypothetical protein